MDSGRIQRGLTPNKLRAFFEVCQAAMLQQRLDFLLRGCRQRQRNAFVCHLRRRRDAEHRLIRRPRRQAIDLGPDHAVEKIGRLPRKIDHTEQHLIGSYQNIDAATVQRCMPLRRQRRLRPAVHETK
jgi:hypothetical protein